MKKSFGFPSLAAGAWFALPVLCILCIHKAEAQAVSISGKVSDQAGKPLSGVVVKLLASGLSDTSGADGAYSITGQANAVLPIRHARSGLAYRNGKFLVAAGAPASIRISLLDARGRLLTPAFAGNLVPGRNEIPFPIDRARAVTGLLRIEIGGSASAYRCIPAGGVHAGGEEYALADASEALPPGRAQAKTSTAAAVEWLQAAKAGYATSVRRIAAYDGSFDFTLAPDSSPDFGPMVHVFDPAMPMAAIQAQIDEVYLQQASSQFGTGRHAFLFKPGAYALNVDIGYYTQAAGLGALPDDVAITGSARSIWTTSNNNVTLSFWRSCENMAVVPTANNSDTWAVSQGAPFRRMHVRGALGLSMGGWASGGFLADTKVDGQISPGSQQQWFTRNTEMAGFAGGVWNMAFVGCTGTPAVAWPAKPFTVVDQTPLVREKPFLTVDKGGHYAVMVPSPWSGKGVSWTNAAAQGISLPIDQFYLAHPGMDDAASLNEALNQGKNLLLTPGIYHLDVSLQVTRPGAVVLGLGMPTLVADNGRPALSLADVDGIKVAGLLIDAGPVESPTLLQVGEAGSARDHSADPASLHDIFCRIGGGSAGTAASCVTVNSSDVLIDHFWLWRADHGAGAGWGLNKGRNGLIVNGARVTAYGLFVEHFQEYQTLWNGEGGRNYFYQSELPYDPPNQAAWQHDGVNGYASYKVAGTVKTHEAWGMGVYSAFRNGPILTDNAFEAPAAAGVKLHHLVSIWLNGVDGSGISNVLNGAGGAATKAKPKATLE